MIRQYSGITESPNFLRYAFGEKLEINFDVGKSFYKRDNSLYVSKDFEGVAVRLEVGITYDEEKTLLDPNRVVIKENFLKIKKIQGTGWDLEPEIMRCSPTMVYSSSFSNPPKPRSVFPERTLGNYYLLRPPTMMENLFQKIIIGYDLPSQSIQIRNVLGNEDVLIFYLKKSPTEAEEGVEYVKETISWIQKSKEELSQIGNNLMLLSKLQEQDIELISSRQARTHLTRGLTEITEEQERKIRELSETFPEKTKEGLIKLIS